MGCAVAGMSNREIRYCTTEDGVRIAYCVEGDGPTTILALPSFNESFALDHLMPVYQQFYRDLGMGRRVIRYDHRGIGLSTDVDDAVMPPQNLTPWWKLDIAAVAQAAGRPCVVWAPTITGAIAIELADEHPELVSQLILCGTSAFINDSVNPDLWAGLVALASASWQMVAQVVADTNGRREFPEEAGQLGDWFFQSETAERFTARAAASATVPPADARPLLSRVTVPTLVLHKIADPAIPFSEGQKLASAIPGARFVPLEGKGQLFCLGDYGRILTAVDDFLGDRTEISSAQRNVVASRASDAAVKTVLFTDIVGHTEMMQRLGDAKGRDVLREHERITRETLKAHGGAEVKTMGDGFMASFGSVTSAVECAIALQRAFATHTESMPEPLHVRVGLNAGEPIEEDGDLFGATVILASRIAAMAGAGEILVPDTVRGLLSGKGFVFGDRGEFVPKGFDEGVRLWDVRWRE